MKNRTQGTNRTTASTELATVALKAFLQKQNTITTQCANKNKPITMRRTKQLRRNLIIIMTRRNIVIIFAKDTNKLRKEMTE